MKSHGHSNALLLELMIAVAFFILSAAVLMQVFAASHKQSERAGVLTQALCDAQNIAEKLYASDNAGQLLEEMGFSEEDGIWKYAQGSIITEVSIEEQILPDGILEMQNVRMLKDGEELIMLPSSRYREVQP